MSTWDRLKRFVVQQEEKMTDGRPVHRLRVLAKYDGEVLDFSTWFNDNGEEKAKRRLLNELELRGITIFDLESL